MALSRSQLSSLVGFAAEELIFEGVAGVLHEGVVVAAFEDAGFDAVGAVGDLAVREVFKKREALGDVCGVVGGGARRAAGWH